MSQREGDKEYLESLIVNMLYDMLEVITENNLVIELSKKAQKRKERKLPLLALTKKGKKRVKQPKHPAISLAIIPPTRIKYRLSQGGGCKMATRRWLTFTGSPGEYAPCANPPRPSGVCGNHEYIVSVAGERTDWSEEVKAFNIRR